MTKSARLLNFFIIKESNKSKLYKQLQKCIETRHCASLRFAMVLYIQIIMMTATKKTIHCLVLSDKRHCSRHYIYYIYIKWSHTCGFVSVFRSHQKSQLREILALDLFWAYLKHDDARFSKFWFLRGGPHMVQCYFLPFHCSSVMTSNLSHFWTQVHENLALGLFFGPL